MAASETDSEATGNEQSMKLVPASVSRMLFLFWQKPGKGGGVS